MTTTTTAWRPKASAPEWFYWLPEDLDNALNYWAPSPLGWLSWLTLGSVGLSLGPQNTAEF